MNRLKKGPEIKLSELRMPQVLVDLYYDLHDRHLLPVVALLMIGIVAVPLLLGGSSESEEPIAQVSPPAPAKTSSLVVTKEAPGLRAYRRRLDHLREKNPFVQQYVQDEEGEAGGEGAEGETSTTEVTFPGGEESSTPSGGSEEPSGGSGAHSELVYFTYAIDVRVVPVSVDGKPSKAEAQVRHRLPPLSMLPSRAVPALTYMGTSKDGKKAIMLVSDEVTALFGDSTCVVGSETCQLLALEPGSPETVVFGANARTYRIELLKMELETTDHINRAPLGKPHPRGDG